jgi:hypothetical protein
MPPYAACCMFVSALSQLMMFARIAFWDAAALGSSCPC